MLWITVPGTAGQDRQGITDKHVSQMKGKKGEREEDERQRQRQRQERSKKETWNFRQVYHPKVCFC